MVSGHAEWLFASLRWFLRISALLLWLLLLAQVETEKVQANTQQDEVQILSIFKASVYFPIDSSGLWGSWKATDENACAWVGVICTANFTVEELDFTGWRITFVKYGGLAMLSELPDLRRLYLSSNELGQPVPVYGPWQITDDVGTLTQLTHLDLSRNFIAGNIPLNIALCTKLRYLSLEQNNLDGTIPDLSGLGDLQILSLAHNHLTGSFPKGLAEISGLVSIDISGNMLNGTIPSLSNLTNLLDLGLDDNLFHSFEEPVSPIAKSLKYLFVSGNQLEGPIPPGMNMLNLQVLNMSNNRLTGEIPSGLALNVTHSFVLDLSQNQLRGKIPLELIPSAPHGTASLNLSYNNLHGNFPIALGVPAPKLLYDILDLSHNQLSGPIPFLCSNEESYTSSLLLQTNMLSGDIVEFFLNASTCFGAAEVRLSNNLFTGDLSRLVNNCGDVTTLVIDWQNYFSILDLSNNSLQMSTTEAVPNPLGSIIQLLAFGNATVELRLGGNNFSGTSLPGNYLPHIYNSFTYVPLDGLRVLDLSNNHLQGEISDVVFNSTWLTDLQFLDISNNDITGNIPESTLQVPSLIVLNVANNHLSGRLPTILRNSSLYNPTFFEGNALCGDPLPPCLADIDGTAPSMGNVTGGLIVRENGTTQWWVYLIIILSVIVAVGSCLVATWRWRVYRRRHQQDADLIKTLMERESATLMSLRELKKATNNFAESSQIGEGGFGTVYTGKLIDGTRVAIKRSKREGSKKNKEQFLNEVRILSQVNHRNLVKLLGCCMENKVALLVFEYVSHGTLQEHLQGKISAATHLSWKQRLNIAVQTADALNYLHSATAFPIYHRDVKSANILLTEDLNAKVADFGISKLAPVEATHVTTIAIQGTMGYIDPEYYTSYKFTSKSDVYSFGVVLLELISAKPPIDSRRGEDETSLVNFADPLVKSGDLQRFIDPTLIESYNDPVGRESILKVGKLGMRCLEMRSRTRPSMNEVTVELQSLFLELYGTFKHLDTVDEDSRDDGRIAIEMLHLSPHTRFEFMANEDASDDLKSSSPSSNSFALRSTSFQYRSLEAMKKVM